MKELQLPLFDIGVVVAYFAGTMLLGLWFMRRSTSTEGFMKAGGALPSWLVGMSIFATYVSSISFLALPGSAYQKNWSRFTFSLGIPLAAVFATRHFVRLYRERGEVSAYSYLEHRFGPLARGYAASFYLLTQIARMGMVMYLVALPLSVLLGWDIKWIILITGISTTIYSMLGGIEGVIWTDAIQGFIKIGGAVLSLLIMLFSMPRGPGQIFDIAARNHKFSLGDFSLTDWTNATFWVILLNGIFSNLNNFGIDQNYVQRYLTAKSEGEARKAVWLGSMLYLPVSLMFFFIGTELYSFYAARPELLPESLRNADMADRVFPYFIVTQLPAGARGLLIAAVFAAAMSTIATSLNSSAAIVYTDFYKRYFRKHASEKESMAVLYATSLLWGAMGTAVALLVIGSKSALDTWWKFASYLSGGMLGLFLLGYFCRRATRLAAAGGMFASVAVILWMFFTPKAWKGTALAPFASPLHDFLGIVMGTLALFLVGFFITLLFSRRQPHPQTQAAAAEKAPSPAVSAK